MFNKLFVFVKSYIDYDNMWKRRSDLETLNQKTLNFYVIE